MGFCRGGDQDGALHQITKIMNYKHVWRIEFWTTFLSGHFDWIFWICRESNSEQLFSGHFQFSTSEDRWTKTYIKFHLHEHIVDFPKESLRVFAEVVTRMAHFTRSQKTWILNMCRESNSDQLFCRDIVIEFFGFVENRILNNFFSGNLQLSTSEDRWTKSCMKFHLHEHTVDFHKESLLFFQTWWPGWRASPDHKNHEF